MLTGTCLAWTLGGPLGGWSTGRSGARKHNRPDYGFSRSHDVGRMADIRDTLRWLARLVARNEGVSGCWDLSETHEEFCRAARWMPLQAEHRARSVGKRRQWVVAWPVRADEVGSWRSWGLRLGILGMSKRCEPTMSRAVKQWCRLR